MRRRNRDTKAILGTIERSELRSPLFWWMVEHHDEMVQAATRRRINWAGFCAEAAKRGLTDTRGDTPSESNARKTWLRARREVEQARAAEATKPPARPGSVFPSRIPKDWRPQVAPPAGSAGAAGSAPVSAQPRSLRVGEVGPRPPPIDMDAPLEFSTVDGAGNPLEEGWVFYRGKVMTRHAAEQLELTHRAFREQDRAV
jgi:hypothetical protein